MRSKDAPHTAPHRAVRTRTWCGGADVRSKGAEHSPPQKKNPTRDVTEIQVFEAVLTHFFFFMLTAL